MEGAMFPLVLLFLLFAGQGATIDDYSNPINCYICNGTAENSTCSDPLDVNHSGVMIKECIKGICLKWTKYKGGVLQMIRQCSADLDFHLTMIDGVCRTERNGNGYLCMCGKHRCNSVSGRSGGIDYRTPFTIILLLASLILLLKLTT
ncbi:protein quiver-like [Physella acuta]|uniref:protein quiver-like n=1 Tax=Physella acuta TaxID=109671 RepID=UPI0027DB2C78|nr:protein quiver-like [Physella acuta]